MKSREVWFDNPLMYVDADTIEPLVSEYYKTILKCIRTFADLPKIQKVAVDIRVTTAIFLIFLGIESK